MAGLLLDGDGPSVRAELHHAEGAGVLHPIAEYRGPGTVGRRGLQSLAQGGGIENVVPQHQADPVLPHELPSDQQGVRNAPGHRLLGEGDLQPVLGSVPQQGPEGAGLSRRDDHHDVRDPGLHQDGDGIIDQRLVIYRQQRLAHRLGHGVESRPLPCG